MKSLLKNLEDGKLSYHESKKIAMKLIKLVSFCLYIKL